MTGSFLDEPPLSPPVQALYDEDLADGDYVWNVSRLWAAGAVPPPLVQEKNHSTYGR